MLYTLPPILCLSLSHCLAVWSSHLKCILQTLLYGYIVSINFLGKVDEKKKKRHTVSSIVCNVTYLTCHWSNVFFSLVFPTHTHTPQTTCVVLRMSGSVVSHKTGVMSLTGQDKITWPRIPSDLPILAQRLTAVEPRRVREQGNYFNIQVQLYVYRLSSTETKLYNAPCKKMKF